MLYCIDLIKLGTFLTCQGKVDRFLVKKGLGSGGHLQSYTCREKIRNMWESYCTEILKFGRTFCFLEGLFAILVSHGQKYIKMLMIFLRNLAFLPGLIIWYSHFVFCLIHTIGKRCSSRLIDYS